MNDFWIVWNPANEKNTLHTHSSFQDALQNAEERSEMFPLKTRFFILKAIGVVINKGLIYEPLCKHEELGVLVETEEGK